MFHAWRPGDFVLCSAAGPTLRKEPMYFDSSESWGCQRGPAWGMGESSPFRISRWLRKLPSHNKRGTVWASAHCNYLWLCLCTSFFFLFSLELKVAGYKILTFSGELIRGLVCVAGRHSSMRICVKQCEEFSGLKCFSLGLMSLMQQLHFQKVILTFRFLSQGRALEWVVITH